ncbi:hypothetical protein JCM8097_008123 [Rhodosporidiobolus ruineniae]
MADPPRPAHSADGPIFVRALYDYHGADPSALSFQQGEVLEILSILDSGWWDGVALSNGQRGWLPSNYTQQISEDEARMLVGGGDARRGSVASLSSAGGASSADYAAGVVGALDGLTIGRDPTFSDFMIATGEDDLTSFSVGGDIFSEIAAAAQAESSSLDGLGVDAATAAAFSSPTASTASPSSHHPSFHSLSSALSHPAEVSPAAEEEEEDYWVPKMTKSGQLFYLNTRTGETSRDMPIDGQGDGVRIDPSEFSADDGEGDADEGEAETPATASSAVGGGEGAADEGDWSPRPTADGRGTYYVNLRTGEQSWDPPSRAASAVSSRRGSLAPGSGRRSPSGGAADAASLLSAWTERPKEKGGDSEEKTLRRASMSSDDSALDVAFAGSARRERKASADVDVGDVEATPVKASVGEGGRGGAGGRGGRPPPPERRPTALTADLLNPLPPPLISDLEEIAMRALQELINTVGIAGAGGRASNRDYAAERDKLARIGDGVVHAVRLVLQASGVLEHPVASSPFAATISPPNEITGPFLHSAPLPPSAQADLRPFSRRLISTLSKLIFSLRAVWGLLETTLEDQALAPEDEDESPADPDELLRRAQARQQTLIERRAVRDARFEHEAKLRGEIMQGTRDVSDQVFTFLQHFQRVVASLSLSSSDGHPPLPAEMLRAPKALQGALRTNAAALLLPGGGFGGNWRGNGFVSLPTPHSSPNVPADATFGGAAGGEGGKGLSYAWPSRPISREVVEELKKASEELVKQAEELKTAAASAKDEAASTALFDRVEAVQDQLAAFLVQVEDVDIAAGVDFQLPRSEETRPLSTTTDGKEDGEADEAARKAYRESVLEVKPLLAELEATKQALYDLAPRLLLALQNAQMAVVTAPSVAGQPLANSPLSFLAPPSLSSPGPDFSAVADLAAELVASPPALCSTMSSLAAIAEVQASAPRILRTHSLAFRNSLFDPSTSSSSAAAPQSAPSRTERHSATPSTQSHDSTFRSSYRSSADSDFFFSGALPDHRRGIGAAASSSTSLAGSASNLTPASQSGGTTNSARTQSGNGTARGPVPSFASGGSSVEVLSSGPRTGLPPGWDAGRRGSVATATTGSSSAGTANPSLSSVNELPSATLSPSRSSSKNIQKLLGEVPVIDPAGGQLSANEPSRPWYLDRDWADEELSFTMENTIKGGTLRGLVIAATSHEGRVESSYLSAFLMTYRTFCTSHELLDQLVQRYLVVEPEDLTPEQYKEWELRKMRPIRARVTNLLKAWVREYMDHEDRDPTLLMKIREFAVNTMTEKGQSLQICKSVDERLQGAAPRPIGNLAPGALPQPILPRNLKKIKLTDLEPLELARQLTIMDSRLFQRITPQECLSKAWPKEFGSEAPNISAMIDMSNAVTRWVTETILAQEDLKKRANVVKHFVAVAERCLALNNFSTLIHIIAGLNSTPIHRLRRTWETVNQKAMISLGGLNNVMRPDKNYREYRDILRKAPPPCVPFLGVYLTDWTFIGDGNADMLREKPHQINFSKRKFISSLILQIKLHQATSYNLQQVPQIAKWLQECLFPAVVHPDAEGHLYSISLALEPRERDDEKIARLLSESGFL